MKKIKKVWITAYDNGFAATVKGLQTEDVAEVDGGGTLSQEFEDKLIFRSKEELTAHLTGNL